MVLQGKPGLRGGQDRRSLPTYTIPEAARYLGIPERTAEYWFSRENKILQPSAYFGHTALLSFRDLSEAYVLALLTKFYGFPMRTLQRIVESAKKETRLQRPLIEADLKVLFRNLILEKPARGGRPRQMIDLAHGGALVFPEFVDQLGRRILKDRQHAPSKLYPWRLVKANDDSRPVSIDPEVVSGRLVVTGTRIPVTILLAKRMKGRSEEELACSYEISTDAVRKALLHIDRTIYPKAA
jgi:uncharacterized protein (DUF433 family)